MAGFVSMPEQKRTRSLHGQLRCSEACSMRSHRRADGREMTKVLREMRPLAPTAERMFAPGRLAKVVTLMAAVTQVRRGTPRPPHP